MIGEEQLAGEPARQPPDRRLFGKASKQPRGGAIGGVGFVSMCHGFGPSEDWERRPTRYFCWIERR